MGHGWQPQSLPVIGQLALSSALQSTGFAHFPNHWLVSAINKIAISGVQWAKQWLKSLAASKLLVLAMMADMSHAAIDLCRFFDKESIWTLPR